MEKAESAKPDKLLAYLTPRTAWALALGTTIGWGSFVVTGTTYLLRAGPVGSVVGLVIGALVMLLIARNYHYMMVCYPNAGGVYTYAKNQLGHDYGFLSAWFLSLTYIAIFWANATSLPLFAKYFLGDVFRFGHLYKIFGYDVYLGEALLTAGAIALTGLLCSRSKRGAARIVFGMVIVFTAAISVCFARAAFLHANSGFSFAPAFIPDASAFNSVCFVAVVSPWAFIGFENISHSIEGFNFPHRKSFKILTAAVLTATALYIFVILLSISAYPPEYDSWLSYIKDLDNLRGIKALPPFYAAQHYMGSAGTVLLMAALLALIVTSLVGNMVALSRLLYAVAKDDMIPSRYAHLNKARIPSNAVRLVTTISILIPFVGRTAIGWIVDVTTIGATIIYG
ncbi:MAG: APC family permease, partial [Treponema sp.]|nr:APC family permease [Treponema sp.]